MFEVSSVLGLVSRMCVQFSVDSQRCIPPVHVELRLDSNVLASFQAEMAREDLFRRED